jgi:hypothetical protein
VASSDASARRFLKRARFSLWMNLSIARSLDQAGTRHSLSSMGTEVGAVMGNYAMPGIGHKAKSSSCE